MHFPKRPWMLLSGAFLLFINAAGQAAETAHPIVAGFERFYTGDKADLAAGGQLLLGELNCVSCHSPGGTTVRKQAPVLDGVANRIRHSYLKKYLSDPHAVKPGSTMPDLLSDDPDKAAKVEAIVQFLASTGSLKQERADPKLVNSGKDLFGKVGCAACHGPREANGQAPKDLPAYAIPLGDLKAKYTIASLSAFLDNPLAVRPSGRMPHLLMFKDPTKKGARTPRTSPIFFCKEPR